MPFGGIIATEIKKKKTIYCNPWHDQERSLRFQKQFPKKKFLFENVYTNLELQRSIIIKYQFIHDGRYYFVPYG